MKDIDGNIVRAGDTVTFSYGIPPIKVVAPVISRDGQLIAITKGHNPAECELRELKKTVGAFYKESP